VDKNKINTEQTLQFNRTLTQSISALLHWLKSERG